jgi:hypothetical protein
MHVVPAIADIDKLALGNGGNNGLYFISGTRCSFKKGLKKLLLPVPVFLARSFLIP